MGAPERDGSRPRLKAPVERVVFAHLGELATRAGALEPRIEAARDLGTGRVVVFERGWDPDEGVQRSRTTWTLEPDAPRKSAPEPARDAHATAHLTGVRVSVRALARGARDLGMEATVHDDGSVVLAGPRDGTFATLRPASQSARGWQLPTSRRHLDAPDLAVSLPISGDARRREAQLGWLSARLGELARACADGVWLPRVRRWVRSGDWPAPDAPGGALDRTALLPLWLRVRRAPTYWSTSGLCHWMLPELTVDATLASPDAVLGQLMRQLFAAHATRRDERLGEEAPALWDEGFRLYRYREASLEEVSLTRLPGALTLGDAGPWRIELDADRSAASRYGAVRVSATA